MYKLWGVSHKEHTMHFIKSMSETKYCFELLEGIASGMIADMSRRGMLVNPDTKKRFDAFWITDDRGNNVLWEYGI